MSVATPSASVRDTGALNTLAAQIGAVRCGLRTLPPDDMAVLAQWEREVARMAERCAAEGYLRKP